MTSDSCFFERRPRHALIRRASAEGLGTLMLVLVVAGTSMALHAGASGIRDDTTLLSTAFAAACALAGLVVAFGPLSGGHFNPLITGLQWLAGARRTDCTFAYVAAQVIGGAIGATMANALWHSPVRVPSHLIVSTDLLSELLATAALMIIVQCCSRVGARDGGPFAVGAWLGGAIVATPTLSLANPAIVVAAMVVDGPMAFSPVQAAALIVTEICGALVAFTIMRWMYPDAAEIKDEDRRATDQDSAHVV